MKRLTCRRFRKREERVLSSVPSGRLGFNRVEECWDGRCPAQSQEHQPEVIRENKMRRGKQKTGKATPAQIRQYRFDALTERERGIFHARTLKKTAREQHERHQADSISRCPEMQFDQRSVTPFAADQTRHDVVHRAENHNGEKCVKTEMRVS